MTKDTKQNKTLFQYRIVFINVVLYKKNHSIVDQKNHYVLQFLSYEHWKKIHAAIHMSSGDKMAPFLASEMAWVCQVIIFI